MTDTSAKKKWIVKFPSEREEKRFKKFLRSRSHETSHYETYTEEVATDPYSPRQPGRIEKLKQVEGYPENTFRWKKANLRVVYTPEGSTKTVWNLERGTATSIPYKKKSRR